MRHDGLDQAGTAKPRAGTPRATIGFVPGPKAVGSFLPKLARKSFERYGFSAATILTDWRAIVGAELSACSAPERLKWPRRAEEASDTETGRPGATLVLRVEGARALDIQYRTAQLIERINAYFGYRAVSEIRILQAPVAPARAVPSRSMAQQPARRVPALVPDIARIEDASLREALARLAGHIAAR
jgi:hypothetical protein